MIYLRAGWGEKVAFLYGWQSLLVMDPGLTAALAVGLSQYLIVLWPAAIAADRWIAVGAIWVLALISMAGLTLSARVLRVLTALKVLALAAVVCVAFTIGDGRWSHRPRQAFAGFALVLLGLPAHGMLVSRGALGKWAGRT